MAEIIINTKIKKNKISPLLYGVFFEDINYGGDGGLYAELVANRSFEYYDRNNITQKNKMCWEELIGTQFEISSEKPLNNIHTHYASISGPEGCGIRNSGFCNEGFAAETNKVFIFSCYARSEESTPLAAVISDISGNILGQFDFVCSAGEWQKYEFELIANKACKNAYLSVILPKGGNVDLEFISLFPQDTFKGRKNGMRRDIAEMIADLKPKFMRFPGGCIVEGRSFENMYNWKDTIDPVEERRTNWNRWQTEEYRNLGFDASDYYQSYGIGFYEYFQFCEDIGAKPVPVVNCGMTCQWHESLLVDMDKLSPFVNDVLDLIEFANGDKTSYWGSRRAEMGHPEPFGLEYIGIGNEQWGLEYFKRYEVFERIISEKYPNIKLITSAGWKDCGCEYDIAYDWMSKNKDKAYAVDEHFYKAPEWFLNNINRYDNFDRSLPKVFIGEWAAHTSSDIRKKKNNWYAALTEAAFLTGVEKNADHVVMSCYAPLLARMDHQQWQPNLIWFDNSNVFGTPSYYIQKLFSEHMGDYSIEALCSDNDLKISASIKQNKLILKIVNISPIDKEIIIRSDIALDSEYNITEISAMPEDENTMKNHNNVFPHVYTEALDGKYNIGAYTVSIIETDF